MIWVKEDTREEAGSDDQRGGEREAGRVFLYPDQFYFRASPSTAEDEDG